jgi:hypothetical protein
MALTYKSYQYYFTGTTSLLHDLVTCTTVSCVVPSVYVTADANSTGIARLLLTKSGGTSVVLKEWKIASSTEQQTLQFLDGPLVLNTGDVLSAVVTQAVFNYLVNYVESTITAQTISTQDLSDWSLTPPTNGQIPTWNSATSQYEPITSSAAINDTDDLSEGSTNLYYTNARADARIAAASIDDLSDVDTTTATPTTGQALLWDGTQWEPGTVSTVSDLDGLTDVSASSPTNGDVIVYNSAINTWVTSQSLANLVDTVKDPTPDTTVIEKDASNKITIDSTTGSEKISATVDGTKALELTDTEARVLSVVVQDQNEVQFKQLASNGGNYVSLKAPAQLASNVDFVLPNADGASGTFLKTNGSGALSFASITEATGSELENVVEDTTPQLGGDLDVNGNKIVSSSNGNIVLDPDGTGNVGIGTTTPGTKLHVAGKTYVQGDAAIGPQANAGTISGYTLSIRDTSPSIYLKDQSGVVGDGRLHIYSNIFSIGVDPGNVTANAALRFETRGSERMRIDHDGNVGIGTASPTAKLHVDGETIIGGGSTTGPVKLKILGTGNRGGSIRAYQDGFSTAGLTFGLEGFSSGAFYFASAVMPDGILSQNLGSAGTPWGAVYTQRVQGRNNAAQGDLYLSSGTTSNEIQFQIAGTEYARLHNNGNLGIGTDAPEEKLHVVGNMVLDGGSSNMFIGDSFTGDAITAGQQNIGIGATAFRSASSTTQYAVAIGSQASRFGNHDHGMAIGYGAGYNGSSSSAYVGSSAGKNASGQRNVGIGYRAGGGNSNGVQNLYGNVSIGYEAGAVLETSATAIGYQALTALTTGTGNTAIGYQAGDTITTGINNTLIGNGVDVNNAVNSNNTIVGASAIAHVNASNQTGLGSGVRTGNQGVSVGAGAGSQTSTNQSALGYKAGEFASGTDGTQIGKYAGRYSTGGYNTLLGSEAGTGVSGTSTFSNTTAVGYQALTALTTGASNVAVGYQAGKSTSTGGSNVAVGYLALANATTQQRNTAVGYGAFDEIIAGDNASYNTGLGYAVSSGRNSYTIVIGHNIGATGSNSVSIGGTAGYQGVTIGDSAKNGRGISIGHGAGQLLQGSIDYNIFIGNQSGYNGNGCSYNTFIGQFSGRNLSGGNNNVLLGYQSGYNIASGSNNVFVGYQSGYNETGSNKLYIENSNSSTPLIYGEFDNDLVRVNGKFEADSVTIDDEGLSAAGDYGKGAEIWYQGTSTVAAGYCYMLDSSGNWASAQANAVGTTQGMLAISAGTDSDVDGMVVRGFVQLANNIGGSVGDIVYLNESSAGRLSTTKPTGAGNFVRRVGYLVKGLNTIYFNPSNEYEAL